jgi:hypothetical protein
VPTEWTLFPRNEYENKEKKKEKERRNKEESVYERKNK